MGNLQNYPVILISSRLARMPRIFTPEYGTTLYLIRLPVRLLPIDSPFFILPDNDFMRPTFHSLEEYLIETRDRIQESLLINGPRVLVFGTLASLGLLKRQFDENSYVFLDSEKPAERTEDYAYLPMGDGKFRFYSYRTLLENLQRDISINDKPHLN